MPLIENENDLDYSWEDLPKCPHCDYVNEDWWDGTTLQSDQDTEFRQCNDCGERYEVTMHAKYTFSTHYIKEKE